jgi:hypothetical protein
MIDVAETATTGHLFHAFDHRFRRIQLRQLNLDRCLPRQALVHYIALMVDLPKRSPRVHSQG